MADLTITAASVLWTSGSKEVGVAGAAITAGQPLYIDTANNNVLKLAQCDGTALEATVAGVALHAAGTGQPISYATPGSIINIGATTAKGMHYFASNTAGAVAPLADIATSTWYFSRIGYATTTAGVFVVDIKNTGVQVT
jgi:hypothetical protein